MESNKQNNLTVSDGSRNHDSEGQIEEDGCNIENGNQHSACLPSILEKGNPFPFPSRNVALILEEKDTLEEESSNYPRKGFTESDFINHDRHSGVEVIAQNTSLNQGIIGQGMKLKAEISTVEPAGNSSIDQYTCKVLELPIRGTEINSEVDPSEDNMEEFKSDTACAAVDTSYPNTYVTSPCKLSNGHKAVTESRSDSKEILHRIGTASSVSSLKNRLQDYEIHNEILSSEQKNNFSQPEDLQEVTQYSQTVVSTEKKEFQDPEQQSEELNEMAHGVNEDQQMHEIHDSEDEECCCNSEPSVDQNQIFSTVVSQQSGHQVTESGNDCRAHVSLGSETVTILEYRQKYLHQDRCLDYNGYYSKKFSPCTDNNVAGKDCLALSSHGQDQKTQIRGPAPVECTYTRHCHAQSSDVQSEIAESASQTSCTREKHKLDADMPLQVPSQLIEREVPIQGSNTMSRTRSTCTVDLLSVIFLNLILMPAVMDYFTQSANPIYKCEIPRFYKMFIRGEFDNIRLEWALKIQERFGSLDFFGEDRDVILPPFHWMSHLCYQPTQNYTGITSGLLRIQSCVELVRPPEGRLNLQVLEQLLFSAFYHERQENVNPLYQDDQNESPPPLIIANFTDAHLNLIHVESLHGIINIGPYRYFVGGFSSLLNRHYTARIYNHSTPEGSVFTYDNDMGQLLPQLYQLGELSLVFLFRVPPQ